MKVIYNVINVYIGNITINIHDNVCYGNNGKPNHDCRNNFTAFVWNSNQPLMTELQQRIEQSEKEKQKLIDGLNQTNRQAANRQTDKL